jgi:hypothetical protein
MTDLGQQIDPWSADPLDEAARPKVTAGRPDRPVGDGRQLIMVHGHLRDELRRVRDAVEEVSAGRMTAADARELVNQLTMRQNYWTLGSFCAAYCRVVTMHHSIEDRMVFPNLAARDPLLGPVVHKLEQEHEVIADVLTALDASLTALMSDDSRLPDVRKHVHLLDRLLTSHLDYEEEQLVEPLGRFGFMG